MPGTPWWSSNTTWTSLNEPIGWLTWGRMRATQAEESSRRDLQRRSPKPRIPTPDVISGRCSLQLKLLWRYENPVNPVDRRNFLRRSALAAGGLIAPSLSGLVSCATSPSLGNGPLPAARPGRGGYGALLPSKELDGVIS